jgi:hypothetical protein
MWRAYLAALSFLSFLGSTFFALHCFGLVPSGFVLPHSHLVHLQASPFLLGTQLHVSHLQASQHFAGAFFSALTASAAIETETAITAIIANVNIVFIEFLLV